MKSVITFTWGVLVFNPVFGAFPPVFPDLYTTLNQFTGSKCKDHFSAYLSALHNYTLWAVQMYDSSVQYPTGVISGNVYQLGNFDQCLKVKVDLSEENENGIDKRNGLLKGQYCLLYVKINPPRKFRPRLALYSLDYDPKASFWVRIQDNRDQTQYKRNVIHWAICIPDSCSPSLLQIFLDKYLVRLQPEYYVSALVKPELCQSAEKQYFLKKFSFPDIIVTLLFIFLIFFVILSTIADLLISYKNSYVTDFNQVNIENFGLLGQILSCFSVKQNVALLMQTNFSNSGFDCIVGLRLLFMVLVISGHRFLVIFNGPIFDTTAAEEGYRKPYNMFILNGMIVVDTFFVYSGLLTAYYLLLEMDDKKALNPFIIWFYRFFRLTPVYLVVLLYYSTLLNHFGSGPLWPIKVGIESQRCANYWWTNIFYLNNYVYTNEMCMFQSWYLSVDTHLFMITVLIVYAVWKWNTIGYVILCFAFFLSVFIPFYFTYITSSAAFLMLYPNVIEDLPSNKYFQNMFVATHMRAGPYMVGVITGILLYKLRGTPIKIPQKFVYAGHICCILLCLGVQFSGYIFYVPNILYHPFITGLYASLHRILWGVSVAVNIFLLVHGRIEWLYKILTWRPLVPVSRLSYCAYLVHTITHLYEAGTARHSNTLSYYTGVWMFIGDIVSTFIISLLLCLTVEAPCRSLERIFLRARKTDIQHDKRNTQ